MWGCMYAHRLRRRWRRGFLDHLCKKRREDIVKFFHRTIKHVQHFVYRNLSALSCSENPPEALCKCVSDLQRFIRTHFLSVACVSYHSAAEGPEPPHEQQGQQEEQPQQGDQKNGAIKLGSGNRHDARSLLAHARCPAGQ